MPSEDSKPLKKDDDTNINIKSLGSKKVTTSNLKPPSKVAAKVKKEEPLNDSSPRPVNASAAASASRSKLKKEDYTDNEDDDDVPLAKRASNSSKEVVKKKKMIKVEETTTKKKLKKGEVAAAAAAVQQKKREKKVYDLPGQKRDPPEEKDPLRIFYESLYQQIPTSEMSQVWLMESGLLPKEIAMKIFEKKQKKGLQQKITSPAKAVSAAKVSSRSVTIKKKSPISPESSGKKKTTTNSASKQNSKAKQSKKRKAEDGSSEEDDSDDDFVLAKRRRVS